MLGVIETQAPPTAAISNGKVCDTAADPSVGHYGFANPVISKLLVAWALMGVCVAVHASGVSAAMRWLFRLPQAPQKFLASTWLFTRVAAWIILLHLVEIAVWGAFYAWQGAMPDLQSAFYFSAVTYTTTGYGDLVLPTDFRLAGGVEALTGILMCGWSTGFFFAIVSRMFTSTPSGGHTT